MAVHSPAEVKALDGQPERPTSSSPKASQPGRGSGYRAFRWIREGELARAAKTADRVAGHAGTRCQPYSGARGYFPIAGQRAGRNPAWHWHLCADIPSASGFYIDPDSIVTLHDVLAVLELRISLEVEAAGLACSRRTDQQLQLMRDSLDALEFTGSQCRLRRVCGLPVSPADRVGHG